MDLAAVRGISAKHLSDALDALGVGDGWALGNEIRDAAVRSPGASPLGQPNTNRRQGFQNQVVGRLAERVFRDEHLAALEPEGFEIVEYFAKGENRDYGAQRDGLEIPVNVKTASTLF